MGYIKSIIVNIYQTYGLIRVNWATNYPYHRGWVSLIRCLLGTFHSSIRQAQPTRLYGQVDILTFSIIPSLTLVWLAFIFKISFEKRHRIFIGDCSGGIKLGNTKLAGLVNVIPFLNHTHGKKLDHFFSRHCCAEYVLICDDDIFFLDDLPLTWGLAQMQADTKLAVVSFVPRGRFVWEINQQKHISMGSYCLLVRRDLWLKEKLSFQVVHKPSPNPKSYRGEYDTADFANVELVQRGYHIIVAPNEIRAHLHAFKGVSSALWEIQSHEFHAMPKPFSQPPDKMYLNVSFCRMMSVFAEKVFPGGAQNLPVWNALIEKTRRALIEKLPIGTVRQIDEDLEQDFHNLSHILFEETST